MLPSPQHNPLGQQVAKTRVVLWVCVLVVLAAMSVRWWPMEAAATSPGLVAKMADASPDSGEADPQRHSSHLDLAAFDRAMWLVPAAPEPAIVAAEKPAPPPPPLTLQLLGLVNENGTAKAILYDSASDRVRVVAVGDSIGDRKVERIDAQGVAIRDGVGVRTLALKGGGAP